LHGKKNPDLILLDFNPSGMDGFGVCEKLSKDRQTEKYTLLFFLVEE